MNRKNRIQAKKSLQRCKRPLILWCGCFGVLFGIIQLIYAPFITAVYAMDKQPRENTMSNNIHNNHNNHNDYNDHHSNPLGEATLAGGCFWCVEADLEKVSGVSEVISGYSGGNEKQPTYSQVSSGSTGHTEAVHLKFDPSVTSYKAILTHFLQHIDPTDPDGSFVDRGKQYRPAIYFHSEEQRKVAEALLAELSEAKVFGKPLAIELQPATKFWPAEEYHQDYYKKNPLRYKFYRFNSGRDRYTDAIWNSTNGKRYLRALQTKQQVQPPQTGAAQQAQYHRPDEAALKEILTPLQYKVTQEEGTERPFSNEYWDEKREGIYVDIVSGEPLFSSLSKFDSGTGWPSFYQTLEKDNIVQHKDNKLFYTRIEVRSKHGDSHLGHLFTDGPKPTGLRYCVNSAALRFIPKESLVNEGYAKYLALFE